MSNIQDLIRRNPEILKQLKNLGKPIKKVKYKHLKVWDENSPAYKRVCPVCKKGALLVQRNPDMTISKFDRCLSCGQEVEYVDFYEVFGPENQFIHESGVKKTSQKM